MAKSRGRLHESVHDWIIFTWSGLSLAWYWQSYYRLALFCLIPPPSVQIAWNCRVLHGRGNADSIKSNAFRTTLMRLLCIVSLIWPRLELAVVTVLHLHGYSHQLTTVSTQVVLSRAQEAICSENQYNDKSCGLLLVMRGVARPCKV